MAGRDNPSGSKMPGRRGLVKPLGFMLRLSVAYLSVLAAITMFQDHLLYLPAKATVGEMVSGRLQAWPTQHDFRGLVAQPVGVVRATVIVFHGNAGHAGHRGFYASMLVPLGLRVILAEYPGYGPRGGGVGELNLVDDAEQTVALAHRLYGPPLLLIGESLGAGVAAAAGARQADKTAGLWLITPWDRLEHVAALHYPWLPVKFLLRDRYDSAAQLASFARPVLVTVAEHDSIVPARFGTALYAALQNPKQLAVVRAAGHNDWTGHVEPGWWSQALSFLLGESAPP